MYLITKRILQQVAPGLSYEISNKFSLGKMNFLVSFDEAISQKEIWIEEKILDDLDRLRFPFL